MKTTLFILLLAGQGINSSAQKMIFEGLVLDGKSKETVPFANVKLVKSSDIIYSQSDFSGIFSFVNLSPGFYNIKIWANEYGLLDTIIKFEEPIKRVFTLFPGTSKYEIYVSDNNINGAKADIEKGTIKLFLPGGIVRSVTFPIDTVFENKYKLKYQSFGCIVSEGDNLNEYNQTIFSYLDKKYGEEWRREIRRDVIGLSEYVTNKR